jgi:predicted RNA-binding Zn-ribbon protein involved in translation (DUF1610 family)
MPEPNDLLTCPSCGRQVSKKEMFRKEPCAECHEHVCYDCIRRKQILPPSWELPAGTFTYRCKRHTGAPLGLGWQKVQKT